MYIDIPYLVVLVLVENYIFLLDVSLPLANASPFLNLDLGMGIVHIRLL